jgi:hypothetical protein
MFGCASNDVVDIDPGSSTTATLSIQNLGDSTATYTVVPSGPTADWVQIERDNVILFDGSRDVIDVIITPPRLPTTTAGPTTVGVRIIPAAAAADTTVAETTVDVRAFDDRRLAPLQTVVRARRRANYEFMVENHGNELASCRLRLIDTSGRIDGDFDPPAVGINPGGASLVRFKARARRGLFRRTTRTLDFEVEAEQPGHDPSAAVLALVQPPTIPGAAIGRIAAAALLVTAAPVAWFGVIRPEIRDAASTRVDERLEQFDGVVEQLADGNDAGAPVTSVAGATGTADSAPRPASDVGEPDFVRLVVTPATAATADAAFTVEDGHLFDLTDVRLENANNDAGRATLSVNGDEAFSWSLANVRGSVFEPRITPIRLEPGDNLTFSVRCDTIGNPAIGPCFNAVNIGGLVIDIDQI